MAKDKSETEIREKREKKEKKEKKRKHDEVDEADAGKAAKKEKKDKKRKSTGGEGDTSIAVDGDGDVVVDTAPGAEVTVKEEDDEKKIAIKTDGPAIAAAVPFANPLCDDKAQKKVLKSVKKAAKHKTLKRGVKECVKAIRKSPPGTPATLGDPSALPAGIVVLAADISPLDVISHIPVLCEDHGIPYVYVPSRAELGAAGSTKRPTSVVMLTPRAAGAKGKEGMGEEERKEWDEVYRELNKLAVKLGQTVKV